MPSNVISYVNNLKKNTNLTDLQEDVIKNYQLSKFSKPIQVLYIPDIWQQFPWEIFEHYNWQSIKKDGLATYQDAIFYCKKLKQTKHILEKLIQHSCSYIFLAHHDFVPIIPEYIDLYINTLKNPPIKLSKSALKHNQQIIQKLVKYSQGMRKRMNVATRQQINQLLTNFTPGTILTETGKIDNLSTYSRKHALTTLDFVNYITPHTFNSQQSFHYYVTYCRFDSPISYTTNSLTPFKYGLDKNWHKFNLPSSTTIQLDASIDFCVNDKSWNHLKLIRYGFNEKDHSYYLTK